MREDGGVNPVRTLVIMRHAKAATGTEAADIDRPLTPRGRSDAAAAGPWLAGHGYSPDLVLCSAARRARETWQSVAPGLGSERPVRYLEDLYGAVAGELLAALHGLADPVRTLLLIGHNPALSTLSLVLDPAGADPGGLRTAGIAVHAAPDAWPAWEPGRAPLVAACTARA
jgi:phosphohistidine phosphatase